MAGVLAWTVVLTTGCTAGMATEVVEPIRPPGGGVEVTALALLPPTTERGSEDAGPVIQGEALRVVQERFPGLPLMDAAEARSRLGRGGAAADLARLFRDYDDAGVADTDLIDRIVDALGVDHFLQLRVGFAETDVLRDDPFSEEATDERRRDVVVVARLWGAGEPAPLWEATARAESETGLFSTDIPGRSEMLEAVVARLLDRLPVVPVSD